MALIEMSDLKVGMIVHFFDKEANTPKNKFSIIVGIAEDLLQLASVFINTEIDPKDLGSPELEELHYEIQQSKYPNVLKHNSYINCAKPIYRMRTEFLDALNGKDGGIMGSLHEKDLQAVKYRLLNGTISPYYLELYRIS